MNVKIITEESQYCFAKIEDFVKQHNNATFLQSIHLYRFYKLTETNFPFYVISEDKMGQLNGILLGVIIRNVGYLGFKDYFSRRCIIEGGPLVINSDHHIISDILITLDKYIKGKVIYSEFRNMFSLEHAKVLFYKNHWIYKEHLNFVVNINEIKNGNRKISRSKKTQIKKSFNNGACIEIAKNEKELQTFYNILHDLYKVKVKKPLPNFDFFKRLLEMDSIFKYFLVKYNNQVIGGILCPIYKDTISEWYVCGEDGKYNNIYPSVLATWAPIEFAIKNDLNYFDFMGAGRPEEDYGVREFKSKFGGDLVENGRFEKIYKPGLFFISKFVLTYLQKLV